MTMQLINYTDVWGNQEDGFEVNNLCYEDIFIEIEEDSVSNKDILETLWGMGFLKTADVDLYEVFDDSYIIEFFAKETGEPLFRRERVI